MTGSLVYLDSSAIVKLVVPEPESPALVRWLTPHPARISSLVARVEVVRAVRRAGLLSRATRRRAEDVLDRIALVALDHALVDQAADVEPPELRSLDAIHLATALSVGADLRGVVTYDDRLSAVAALAGIEVWAPT